MAYLPAGEIEIIKVSPGEKIAAIRNSADGTLFCTLFYINIRVLDIT
jgi:hypothetical protein